MAKSIISDAKLAKMRAAVNKTLPDQAIVVRTTSTSVGRGVEKKTEQNLGPFDCRIVPISQTNYEQIYLNQVQDRQIWLVIMPFGTDIKVTDAVIIHTMRLDVIDILPYQTWQTEENVICAGRGIPNQ